MFFDDVLSTPYAMAAAMDQMTDHDDCVDGSAVSHSLIRVDGPAKLLAVAEFLNQLLRLEDTSGTTAADNPMHIALVNATVADARPVDSLVLYLPSWFLVVFSISFSFDSWS